MQDGEAGLPLTATTDEHRTAPAHSSTPTDVEYGALSAETNNPHRQAHWVHAVFLLLAQIVGTGVLELGGNLAAIGWIGIVPLLLFAPVNIYTGVLLTRLRTMYPRALSLTDLGGAIFGATGAKCTAWLIYSYMVLACASYLLVLATTLQSMFFDFDLCHPKAAAIGVALLMPFAQARTLTCVSTLSIVSVITIGGTVLICISALLGETAEDDAAFPTQAWIAPSASYGSTLAALCGFCFAYAGQSIYLEIMAEMQRPQKFPLALLVANGPMVALYGGVASLLYSRRGARTPPMLTDVLPFDTTKVVASALLAVHIIVSYVITQQVLCTAAHRALNPLAVGSGALAQTRSAKLQWLALSSAVAASSWLLASALPYFEILTSLIGALQSAPICLGIPALFYLGATRGASYASGRSSSGGAAAGHTAVAPLPCWERAVLYTLLACTMLLVVGGVGGSLSALRTQSATASGMPFACHCHSQACSAGSDVDVAAIVATLGEL